MDAKPERPRHPLSHPRAHPRLGINAERGCTDCPVLLLLLIVWAGGFFVAQLAFANGKPANLLRGTDYLANTCGQGDFANMPVLWYPISFNIKTGDLVIKDALKMGLCLAQCPKLGDRVKVYGNLSGTYMPNWWLSLFDSKPKLNRCFPDFASFNCSDSSPTDVANCAKQLLNANNTWSGLSVFEDTFESGFETLQTLWWVVLAGMLIIIALSFLWLALLRHIVKPIVVLTAILVLVALVGLGYVLWIIKGKKEALDPPQTDEANYYMYGAIVAWIIAFIYLCVMIFLREDVMTACDIIEEATKVPGDIPTMLLVPPCSFLACIPFIAFFLVVAVYIQSSGEKVTFNLPLSNTLNSTAALFNSVQNFTAISSNTTNLLTQQYTFSNWRIYAHFYNLFVMLWSVGLVGAISFMTVAMCGVFWYWSVPGDKKEPPLGSVCIGMRLVLRYHLGTVALGSFMVALVQLMRVVLAVVEYQMQQVKSKTDATKYIFTCIQCMLACLERVIKFINKNGYIMCAMQGTNFVTSARDALNLLAANALSVGALTIISEYVILFGKVLVTVAGVILTWLVLQQVDDSGLKGGWLILFIVLVLGYLISCLFANVFSVCIDTVLLSYCYDKQEEGDDYYPADLAAHVSKATLAKGRKIDAITHGDQELKVPLHPGKEKQSGKAVDPLEGL